VIYDTWAGVTPRQDGRGGDQQFQVDARDRYMHPLPFRTASPGTRYINVRNRRKQHQHDSRTANRTAVLFGDDPVRQLVKAFEYDPTGGEPPGIAQLHN
jgi:hypothetical protein